MKLRKGNVFAPVCDSVHKGESLSRRGSSVEGGHCLESFCPQGSLSTGGLCPGGSLSRRGLCLRGVSVRDMPPMIKISM